MPTSNYFQKALDDVLSSAQQKGAAFVDVCAGDLHRTLGGYPGHNHRMPLCCSVLYKNQKAGDQLLKAPPKGSGAIVNIRYKLPR